MLDGKEIGDLQLESYRSTRLMNDTLIVSYNARGLGDNKKCRGLFNLFHSKHFKIILVQETHCKKEYERVWKAEWGGKIYFSHGNTQQRGVAILFSKDLDIKTLDVYRDTEGRVVFVKALLQGQAFLFGSIYAPNKDDPHFFLSIINQIEQYDIDRKIIGGDYNLILDHGIDRVGKGQHKHVKAREVVNELIEELEFIVYRHMEIFVSGQTRFYMAKN